MYLSATGLILCFWRFNFILSVQALGSNFSGIATTLNLAIMSFLLLMQSVICDCLTHRLPPFCSYLNFVVGKTVLYVVNQPRLCGTRHT